MGYFIVDLPNSEVAHIRWGIIRKKSVSFNLFKPRKSISEIKKGYIVHTGMPGEQREYRLARNSMGEWLKENDDGFPVTKENETVRALMAAIDRYEKSQYK